MKITETKRFTLTPTVKDAVRVTFVNRKGGTDCATFTRFADSEIKTKPLTYFANLTERTYSVEGDKTVVYHSQNLTEADYAWLQDLMFSPNVAVNNKAVRVLDSSYSYDSVDRIWKIELKTQDIYGENKITL